MEQRARRIVIPAAATVLALVLRAAPAPAGVFRVTTGGVDNDLRAGLGTLVWERGADFVRYDDSAKSVVTLLPSTDVVSSAQVGTNLYFATQHDLYITDGTNTASPATISPASYGPAIAGLRELNGQLLFGAFTTSEGWEPWTSNGTGPGTVLVKDIYAGYDYGDYYPSDRAVLNGYALFNGDDGTHGEELWATNGTAPGTTMVLDARAGTGGSEPHGFVTCGPFAYFSADDGSSGRELWRTDGSGGGTLMVADVRAGAEGSSPMELTCVGARVYFLSSNPATFQHELWVYDPANGHTQLKADWGCTGFSCGPRTHTFRAVNGLLLFAAGDAAHGVELWRSDGTAPGTVMVRDLWPGLDYSTGSPYPFSSDPYDMEVKDGKLYFRARHPDFGGEVWASDGTAANTWPVTDVVAGPGNSWPDELTSAGRFLFFRVTGDDSYNVWGFDPTDTPPYRDLVRDGSFESAATGTNWTRLALAATRDARLCTVRSYERCSFRIVGSRTAAKGLRQVIPRSGALGDAGETITLSGWSSAKSASAAGGFYGLEILLTYRDGTSALRRVSFARGTHAWQYRRLLLRAAKPWSRATIYARYQNLLGTAWFDDIRLTVR